MTLDLDEQKEKALHNFEQMKDQLFTSKIAGKSPWESKYGLAHRELVRLGLAPKIKQKYRASVS